MTVLLPAHDQVPATQPYCATQSSTGAGGVAADYCAVDAVTEPATSYDDPATARVSPPTESPADPASVVADPHARPER